MGTDSIAIQRLRPCSLTAAGRIFRRNLLLLLLTGGHDLFAELRVPSVFAL